MRVMKITLCALLTTVAAPVLAVPAFPGAVGWAAETPGGRGGRIIRVTTLAADGPGSLRAAVAQTGPRIIVFEVGGIIDLGRSVLEIKEPYVTIAGQTAPSPGITIIRGGVDVKGHDVVMRHIRVRTGVDGQAHLSGWEADAFSTVAAHDVIVDHCTFGWAIDENMSASGPRFNGGDTVAEWRKHTSYNVTFSNNLAAEGLANASHPKGEHSKGSLIHDNATGIMFYRNVWAHNVERSPLLKGGVQAAKAADDALFGRILGQKGVQRRPDLDRLVDLRIRAFGIQTCLNHQLRPVISAQQPARHGDFGILFGRGGVGQRPRD